VKIILQVQSQSSLATSQRYQGLRHALKHLPEREGGWRSLYRGNGANVLRLVPEVGFKFVVHDQFKVMFAPADGGALGLLERLAAGAATGVLKTLLFYPLDLSRVRITADLAYAGAPRNYTTIRQALATTFSQEGVRGLYKGVLLSMLGIVPYLSCSMTAYDTYKQQLPVDKVSRAQWWYPLAKMGCGSAAAVSAQLVTYPLDTVRRRMQLNGAKGMSVTYRSVVDCVKHMIQTEGLPAFYRGAAVNALKTMPGAAIQFVAYDFIKTTVVVLDPTTGVSSPL